MARDMQHDTLNADLALLGRTIPESPVGPDLVHSVMTRVETLPVPRPETAALRLFRRFLDLLRRARTRALLLLGVAVLALLIPTPVGAAVLEWFGFAGVMVREDPNPAPSIAPAPPSASAEMSLAQARKRVVFAPVILPALGPPQGVEVSPDRRVLSMTWTREREGTIRLDQFDGRLDYGFAKTAAGVHFTSVAGDFALWFNQPHEVVVLNRDGTQRTETARLAGHTLIWERSGITLRLEGELDLVRAVELAETASSVP